MMILSMIPSWFRLITNFLKNLQKVLDIYTNACYYNIRKEVNRMAAKGKKKPTKNSIDWRQTLVGALVDLIVGLALLIIQKMIE